MYVSFHIPQFKVNISFIQFVLKILIIYVKLVKKNIYRIKFNLKFNIQPYQKEKIINNQKMLTMKKQEV